VELQIPHPPSTTTQQQHLLNFLSNPQIHNPTKTPKTINPRQMGNNPPQMETTHKTQNNDARKLKIRINNGSEQEQQQQSRKQSSAIFLTRVYKSGE